MNADRDTLRQALINIIENAITHCPSKARIEVDVEGAPPDHVTVTVRDDGPEIAPEHLERIFDRFYRVERHRAPSKRGTGLGLATSPWAVESHGGRINVISERGKGTEFRIVLPSQERP